MTVVKPVRPGTRHTFVGELVPVLPISLADIEAVGFTHNWGPLGESEDEAPLITNPLAFDDVFGNDDTDGRAAVISALAGQGSDDPNADNGEGGAGAVLAFRMAGTSAAAATRTIQNTAATNALALEGRYVGTYGNRIRVTITDDPGNAAQSILRVYLDAVGGEPRESYTFADADVAGLALDINNRSRLLKATVLATGTALPQNPATVFSLTGGDDGATLTAGDYTDALGALTFQRFSVLAFQDLTDAGIIASVDAWADEMERAGRPVDVVVGGDDADTLTTALARSAAISNPNVNNLGIGRFVDELTGRTINTAQMAPRYGGILCARGVKKSTTFARIAGVRAVSGTTPLPGEVEIAIQNGVTVFTRSLAPGAKLRVEKGVTTHSVPTPGRPVNIFGDPRVVRLLHGYIRTMNEWGDLNIVGASTVSQETRDAVYTKAKNELDALELAGLIEPGTGFANVPTPEDPNLRDAIIYDFGWTIAQTTNNLLGQGRIR